MSCSDDPGPVMKKAFPRVIKSLLHMRKWEAARDVLFKYDLDIEEVKKYGKIIDQAESVWAEWSVYGELDGSQLPSQEGKVSEAPAQSYKKALRRLFLSVPRYKVAM